MSLPLSIARFFSHHFASLIAAGVSFCSAKNSWDKSTHDLQAARHSVGRKDLVPTRRPLSASNHSQGGAQQLLHSSQKTSGVVLMSKWLVIPRMLGRY